MEVYVSQFVLFMLLFARITSLIVAAPAFGHQSVPVQVKVGVGAFIALVMFPAAQATSPLPDLQFAVFVLTVVKEIMVGLVLGCALGVLFSGIRYAGELISFSMGLSLANIFDPESSQQTPVLGEFIYLVTLLIFFALNGHHFVLEALQLTYAAVPVGGFTMGPALADRLVALAGTVFVVAVKVAAPVMVAIFLTNVSLSILARVMPQMNVFIVSFPLNIAVGLVVLMSSSMFLVYVFRRLLTGFEANVIELVKVM